MPKITPFLWFDDQAEEAVEFYLSVFPNSRVVTMSRYGDGGPGPAGSVMTVLFELDGDEFMALNGGPKNYGFDESISFVIDCPTTEDVDHYWQALTDGGEEIDCGWEGSLWRSLAGDSLRFPVCDGGPGSGAAQRAMQAMMTMKKLDMDVLRAAADGVTSPSP